MERRDAEGVRHQTAELREGHFAAIIECSNDAIISKDLDGTILSWNPSAEKLFGYNAAEAMGRPITMLIPRERSDEESDILGRIRQGLRVEHYETVRVRKDGRRIDISLTVSPIRDATGGIIGVSKIARDISERRRLEEEHAHLLEAERGVYLDAQRARREAEQASGAKDAFLAMVSHELRTPLNALAGWLQVLRAKPDDPALAEQALEVLDRNVKVLTKIVSDLLDVSRGVAGKTELSRQPVDVAPTVEAVVDVLRPLAAEKGVTLRSAVSPWAGPVLADLERLQQIIGNIVGNAIKFTGSGGRIEVRASNEGSQVEIVVSDTGRGIPPDVLPHVFEAFRQGEGHASGVQGGLGLGLAIVKHLVELHEGTVIAESDGVGRGARFTVRLPLLPDVAPPPLLVP
jgi:PAS domain S-box-containing protein